MKRFLTAHVAAITLSLILVAGLQASPLPPDQISWSYNWTPGAPALFSDGGDDAGVTFTNEPTKVAVGSSTIVATNLRVFSSATAATGLDSITGSNGNYSLSLTLTADDGTGPKTATLTFTGALYGTFSAENSYLPDEKFTDPNPGSHFIDAGPKVAELGNYKFTVQLTNYTPPGPPDQSNAGSIAAFVSVENVTPVGTVPEPSALVLGGMGLTFLGGAALRRFRKVRAAA